MTALPLTFVSSLGIFLCTICYGTGGVLWSQVLDRRGDPKMAWNIFASSMAEDTITRHLLRFRFSDKKVCFTVIGKHLAPGMTRRTRRILFVRTVQVLLQVLVINGLLLLPYATTLPASASNYRAEVSDWHI